MLDFLKDFKPLKLEKEFAGVRLPRLEIDKKYYKQFNIPETSSNVEFLKKLCSFGFKNLVKEGKIDKSKIQEYRKRAEYEVDTLEKLNFIDYILIVWDVSNFCDENNILRGPSRGSSAGSLVCYLTGITTIDPLKYGLFFERFISASRAKSEVIDGEIYLTGVVPDIDGDYDYLRRHEAIEYLDKKYPNKTSKIVNLSTLTGKNLIKECGKSVAGKSESEMNYISGLIPQIFGVVQDIEDVYNDNKEFRAWCDENKEVYDIALSLRGLIKNKSVHASGIVISPENINDICPVEKTKDNELVCGFDMNDIGSICVKLDLLGLKTLTVIDDVCKLVNIKMMDIDINHPSIYALLQDFKYGYGIFQLEAGTADKVTKLIKPRNIQEISAIMGLARPGGMDSINKYVDFKNQGYGDSIHPLFDDILKNTYQIPIYQESLMQMLNAIGFTLEEGYQAIKVIGKKLIHEVKAWEKKIQDKVKENNVPVEVGNILYNVLNASANYLFNFSHSVAYSVLCAYTAYLKANYPLEFLFACLKMAKYEQDREECIFRISNELNYYGYKLLPPNIKYSQDDFSIEENGIRFGLLSIKGIQVASLSKLKEFGNNYTNKFEFFEAAKQAGINIGILGALIQSGAIGEEFSNSRSKLVLESQIWNLLTPREKNYCLEHGLKNDFNIVEMVREIDTWMGGDGKKVARSTRLNTIKKRYEPYKRIYMQNSKYEDFANWIYEKRLLGISYSKTLKEIFLPACPQLISIEEFKEIESKDARVTLMGMIIDVMDGNTKKAGRKYTKFIIEDGSGLLNAFVFDEKNDKEGKRTELKKRKRFPKIGDVAAFRGKRYEEIMILDDISVQSEKVYVKLSEMKDNSVKENA